MFKSVTDQTASSALDLLIAGEGVGVHASLPPLKKTPFLNGFLTENIDAF